MQRRSIFGSRRQRVALQQQQQRAAVSHAVAAVAAADQAMHVGGPASGGDL